MATMKIQARFRQGRLEPLQRLSLADGELVSLTLDTETPLVAQNEPLVPSEHPVRSHQDGVDLVSGILDSAEDIGIPIEDVDAYIRELRGR